MSNDLSRPLKGETLFKVKGYPGFYIIFNYDEEVYYVFHKGVEIGSCLTNSEAKAIVKQIAKGKGKIHP